MSPTNRSEWTYATFASLLRVRIWLRRVHQVRLAETDAAIDEQRVVSAAGFSATWTAAARGELVALALDEVANVKSGFSRPPNAGVGLAAGTPSCVATAAGAEPGLPTGGRARVGRPAPSVRGAGAGATGRREPISTTTWGTGAGTSSSTSSPIRAHSSG